MATFDSTYPEIKNAIHLFRSLRGQLSSLGKAEHCRAVAKAIYKLQDLGGGRLLGVVAGRAVTVQLHLRLSDRSVQLKDGEFVLILYWQEGAGLSELFNGPAEEFSEIFGKEVVPFDELILNLEKSGPWAEVLLPAQPWQSDEARRPGRPGGDEVSAVHDSDGDRNGDGGGRGRGGGGGGDGGNGPGSPNGSGGMTEVVAHRVLFSVNPDYYDFLLESY